MVVDNMTFQFFGGTVKVSFRWFLIVDKGNNTAA